MAGLVLGAIGGFFFGPIGFLIGSMIGNLLMPQGKQEGPRLSNLRLQGSSFGQMIPILYGMARFAGQVIWTTDLKEHKHKTGGKGGPQVTTYTYTASFAIKICKPVAGLVRIWANGMLIYDTTGQTSVNNSNVPLTFYPGVETANPDPTMEAALGVGNVPAFRDDAVAVFTDMELGDYGNMIPTFSFQVFTSGGPIPWRVALFTPFNTLAVSPGTYEGTGPQSGVIEDGQLLISRYLGSSSAVTFELNHYDLQGNLLSSDPMIIGPPMPCANPGGNITDIVPCLNNPHVCFGRGQNGVTQNSGFYYDGAITVSMMDTFDVSVSFVYSAAEDAYYVLSFNSSGEVRKFAAAAGVISTPAPSAVYSLAGLSLPDPPASYQWAVTVAEDGSVWISTYHRVSSISTTVLAVHLDKDLNEIARYTKADVPATFNNVTTGFVAWNGYIYFSDGVRGEAYTPGTPFVFVGELTDMANGPGNFISLGGGLVLDANGISSLNPRPGGALLGDIVADLSQRSGLSPADYDVSELTDTVPGYIVSTRADTRQDILPLQSAYFFDGVESSGVMKFVKRGKASVITIPDNDLAAQVPGGGSPALVEAKRMQEVDLPARVDVKYMNLGNEYQDGNQSATRQTTRSQAVAEMQLPIALADADAARIATINLYEAGLGREAPLVTYVPRKYVYLEPTDVFTAHGYVQRILRKTDMPAGIIKLESIQTNQSLYLAAPVGNPTSGPGPTPPTSSQPTALLLLDIPLVADTDTAQAVYAAMAGTVDATWRGAALNKSDDGGANYTIVDQSSSAAVMGVASSALGDWQGGNLFDEINSVTVLLGPGSGGLASASELAVLNGGNLASLGNELIQFKGATLTAPRTYLLTGLLRGRRGTEWATPSHLSGEAFCLLPVDDIPLGFGELGQSRLYKAVTVGGTLAGAATQPFTSNGRPLLPYAPVQLGGGPITPFDGTVQLNWIRRTRTGGAWSDYVDVQLGEASEQYVVQIWDSTYTNVARIIVVTSPTTTYTAAQQVTDFGATQLHVYFTVGQIGAYLLGTQASGVVPGLGASDDAVIAPIPPYNSAPPPPTGGCTLPTTVNNFVWAAPVSQFNPGAGPTGTWVCTFTTGSIVAGAGSINAAEYAGPPTQRDAVLALSPCGAPLTPASHQVGNTVSVIFYMQDNPHPTIYPTLLPATTYYFSINSLASSGMICNLSTPH